MRISRCINLKRHVCCAGEPSGTGGGGSGVPTTVKVLSNANNPAPLGSSLNPIRIVQQGGCGTHTHTTHTHTHTHTHAPSRASTQALVRPDAHARKQRHVFTEDYQNSNKFCLISTSESVLHCTCCPCLPLLGKSVPQRAIIERVPHANHVLGREPVHVCAATG